MAQPELVHVIGGGLAGSEASWQLASAGVPVVLHEMRPVRQTDAHKTDGLAELVCSNSFRSDEWQTNAVGLLHEEMRRAGSLIMAAADRHKLPAGGALAVDRDAFSADVTERLAAHPLVSIERGEIAGLPPADWSSVIVATGPLTSPAMTAAILELTGEDSLAFFDAIAPIVHYESIDHDIAWKQSRYDKAGPGGGGADYINCPMTKSEYDAFIDALIAGEKTEFKEWGANTPYFDGCLPIEVMAERGRETLRFGPMKPVGLADPRKGGHRPYAVVQLRQDNALGTLWNIVGFQTKLKYAEQTRIFRMIPGLGDAQFARLGGLHRNTFLNSPVVLDGLMRLKADPRIRFAGQITGVEGYVESAAMGLVTGRLAAAERLGRSPHTPPATTALGALVAHITGGHIVHDLADESSIDAPEGDAPISSPATPTASKRRSFQPMNINYGLIPPIEAPALDADGRKIKGKDKTFAKKRAASERALRDLAHWLAANALKTAAE